MSVRAVHGTLKPQREPLRNLRERQLALPDPRLMTMRGDVVEEAPRHLHLTHASHLGIILAASHLIVSLPPSPIKARPSPRAGFWATQS
jgi:hypothetical protein